MSERIAVRNIERCEKDCLCLYVCPTGASDTENSIIDVDKCIGCGACADACPSKAIVMVPKEYPPQQEKEASVIAALRQLISSKTEQEEIASSLPGVLAAAFQKSNRIMAEDLLREAGFMLPQSGNSRDFLESLRTYAAEEGFPADSLESLLDSMFVKLEDDAPKANPYAGTQTEKNLQAAFAGESEARN